MPAAWRIAVLALFVARAVPAQTQAKSLIGNGWGLDHVIVAQRSFDDATQIFGAKLGFSFAPGNKFPDQGLENGPVLLPPAYLELMWIYDPEKNAAAVKAAGPGGPLAATLRRIQAQGGAIISYNIDVSPVEQAASFVRARGFKVSLPPSPTTLRDGKQQPGAWQFLNISYEDSKATPPVGVPGGPGVGFLEYRNNGDRLTEDRLRQARERIERETPDPRRKPGDLHANTARKLKSVWVAVSDLQQTVKHAEAWGFAPGRERTLGELGARGREVQCGQGTIVFWEADKEGGPLSTIVRSGGLGPFGVSVGVEDLNRAHDIAEHGTGRQLHIEKNQGRDRFLVSAEAAGGIWVEFVQE